MSSKSTFSLANTTSHQLSHPASGAIHDAIIVERFLQQAMDIDVDDFFSSCCSVPRQNPKKTIPFSKHGMDALMVTGDHPALSYRGNALKRHKMWLQTDYKQGVLKYGYTGWQHAVAPATRDIGAVPVIANLMERMNAELPTMLKEMNMPSSSKQFNHAIFTRYEDEHDFIGHHADKERDFEEGSYFVVFKFGAERMFEFTTNEGEVFWKRPLPAGTMLVVRAKSEGGECANSRVKHGVPRALEPCGPSGSVVFRAIRTVVPWEEAIKNVAAASKSKLKRRAAKAASRRSSSTGSTGSKKQKSSPSRN